MLVTEPMAEVLATGPAEAEQTAWEAGTSRAAVAETGRLSEEVREAPRVTADRVHELAAAAVRRAWGLEEEVVVVAVEGAGEGKRGLGSGK